MGCEDKDKKGCCCCKKCPFWQIWLQPRETVRKIAQKKPSSGFWLMSFIYGFSFAFYIAQGFSLARVYSLLQIVLGSVIVAIPLGAVCIIFFSLVTLLLGKLIRGGGSLKEIKTAVVWSVVPTFVVDIIWITYLLAFGHVLFDASFPTLEFSGGIALYLQVTAWITVITSIWGVVILVVGISEVQKFSVWMALLNVVLSSVVVSVVYFGIIKLFEYMQYSM